MLYIVVTYLTVEILYFLISLVFFSSLDKRKDFSFYILIVIVCMALFSRYYPLYQDTIVTFKYLSYGLLPVYLFIRIKSLLSLYKNGLNVVKWK